MKAYVVEKDGELKHTWSKNKLEDFVRDDWKHILTIDGWNMSFSYGTTVKVEDLEVIEEKVIQKKWCE